MRDVKGSAKWSQSSTVERNRSQKKSCYHRSNCQCSINKEGTSRAVHTKVNSLDTSLKVCTILSALLNRDELVPNPAIHYGDKVALSMPSNMHDSSKC